MALAITDHTGEDISAQLDRMPMPLLGSSILTFALHSLEQAIHRCSMHRNDTAHPCDRGSCSLLHLPDNLLSGCLAYLTMVWCCCRLHHTHSFMPKRNGRELSCRFFSPHKRFSCKCIIQAVRCANATRHPNSAIPGLSLKLLLSSRSRHPSAGI